MKVDEFLEIVATANRQAIHMAWRRQINKALGNSVILLNIQGRKRQKAIKMGAIMVDTGLLFRAPAFLYAERYKTGWANAFATVLVAHGLYAYVIQEVEG